MKLECFDNRRKKYKRKNRKNYDEKNYQNKTQPFFIFLHSLKFNL